MALQKEFEVENTGNFGKYIRIISVNFDADAPNDRGGISPKLVVSCGLYKDKASRAAGKSPATVISVNILNIDQLNSFVESLYVEIKKLPELKGALDV